MAQAQTSKILTPIDSPTTSVVGAGFFAGRADTVARELLGKWLVVCSADGQPMRHLIVETEAYMGAHDLACHGRTGQTQRNATMFGPAGRWYVYLCYGMHWMLNIVTGEQGTPAAVLLRGLGDCSGPGRLTKALGIDRSFDGQPASRHSGLWFEHGGTPIPRRLIHRSPRIGVGYAGEWAQKPLRFFVDAKRLAMIRSELPAALGPELGVSHKSVKRKADS
ncbi:MAG: DNA-3-methyladenine glycosylase [Planctomycetota bacterium]